MPKPAAIRHHLRGARIEFQGRREHLRPATIRNRQVHSARIVEACPGRRQDADGLFTDAPDRLLAIETADCLPAVLVGGRRLVALHVGWRGLLADILERGVDLLESPSQATAWLGPAIGPCCFEVGPEVALPVAATCGAETLVAGARRWHVDLWLAAQRRLERLGLVDTRHIRHCTYCDPGSGWSSFRRDGRRPDRNLTYAWWER